MKIGWLFIMMLLGSTSAVMAGIRLVLSGDNTGIMSIILGTTGFVSYLVAASGGNRVFDIELSSEKLK